VRSIDEALPLYRDVFGLPHLGTEEVPEQKVRVAMLAIGEATIELLEALTPDSPIAKFLDAKGEGIHHLAFRTDDIRGALKTLKASGIRLIHERPSRRGDEYEIAFIHPHATRRVLIELCQTIPSSR